ncbi:MAG TPA: glycosyltransferase [Caulobacteraceae bacterium]|jgi:glycosyltransferase involved in cell wall biosynthesis|nr:glycosyltransferase [Caulobacteraceae bacterium]
MTVLHLLGSPGDGGAETYFLHLVAALAADGLGQAAALHANAGRERALGDLGVPAFVLPYDAPFDFVTGRRIRRLAQELPARVLLQWMNRAGRVVPRRGPWARIGRLGGYYDLKYYKGCDLLVGNTRDIVRHIVGGGWPAERAVYIPNFAAAGGEPAQSRAALDTPEGAPLLLAMGRLHKVKGHDVSLKALARLPEAWLWIAGSGPAEHELKALAARLGVAGRVRFLGWRDDAAALYRAADVCLFPSRYEPLGNTVIQAWAHEAPIVAAASQGPGVLIRDGEDGLLTPIDDDEALAAGARRLIHDRDLAGRLAAAGRERVATEFAKAPVVAQWREIFARYGEG